MAKQDNTIFWIIGIGLLILIVFPKLIFPSFAILPLSNQTCSEWKADEINAGNIDISATEPFCWIKDGKTVWVLRTSGELCSIEYIDSISTYEKIGYVDDIFIQYQNMSVGWVVRIQKSGGSTTWVGLYDYETQGKKNANSALMVGWITNSTYNEFYNLLKNNPPGTAFSCISQFIEPEPEPEPIDETCIPGTNKCIGTFYHECENNQWISQGEINGKCGYVIVDGDIEEGTFYYWFDDDNEVCSYKKFYGAFTYEGLKTFTNLQDCQDTLSDNGGMEYMAWIMVGIIVLVLLYFVIKK